MPLPAIACEPIFPRDAAAIASLHLACFPQGRDIRWDSPGIAALVASRGGFGLFVRGKEVGLDDEVPAGFILCRFCAEECEILSLGVAPLLRRRGLAAALLETAIGLCREKGVTRMILEVAESNTMARRFYEKQGFALIGRRKDYYGRGESKTDALVLACPVRVSSA